MLKNPDEKKIAEVTEAFLKMKKFDLKACGTLTRNSFNIQKEVELCSIGFCWEYSLF